MDKQTYIKRIRSFLINRRHVFFKVHPDPKKQQKIIHAEFSLALLKSCKGNEFQERLRQFADRFVLPLVPSRASRLHDTYMNLYNQIKQHTT